MTTHPINELVHLIPLGWTLAHLTQNDDRTWYCEFREGHLTSYSRVISSETRLERGRPQTPYDAILECLAQLTPNLRPKGIRP